MNAVNFKDEKFLTFDDQLLKDLKDIEDRIRLQFQTPGKHYPVAELLQHSGNKFFNLWNEKEFPTYMKKTEKKEAKEYRGIYVFASERDGRLHYDYVGISRGVKQRFQWHATGTIINHATWAWLMVAEKEQLKADRKANKDNKEGLKAHKQKVKELLKARQADVIHRCKFTFVHVESDMMLHLAEIYCASHLQTHWNSFRTH